MVRKSNTAWRRLVGEFADPDLVAGFQNFQFAGVEGEEGVYGGLGDAVLIVVGIVPEVIVEGDDGAGLGEWETLYGVFQDFGGGVAAVNVNEVVAGDGQSAQSFAGRAAFELGAFFSLGLLDVGPEEGWWLQSRQRRRESGEVAIFCSSQVEARPSKQPISRIEQGVPCRAFRCFQKLGMFEENQSAVKV